MEFHRGLTTLRVPFSLHAKNRSRLVERFQSSGLKEGYVVLKGAPSTMRFDTDHEPVVRQESFFQWAFGVKEPDCFASIDVSNGKSTLFVPHLPDEYAVWMGDIKPCSEYKETYEVDECKYVEQLKDSFPENATLFLLRGKNTDSGNFAEPAHFEGIEKFKQDTEALFPKIVELRTIKTEEELEVLRYINKVSSEAHKRVMSEIKAGMMEYQMEARFQFHCHHDGGARHQAYTCICASGINAKVLHYGHAAAPNEKQIQDGEMVLFDMGSEYHCYCADITCSYPVNGKFTEDQKTIYNIVLDATRAVEDTMKEGVSWIEMHRLAEKVICAGLRDAGILKGTDEEFAKHNLGALFMPHGLGHFLGLDTHDVGGYLAGMERPSEPGIKKLRCGHVLKRNMVLTVEPGLYFIPMLLEKAFEDPVLKPFFIEQRCRQFFGFGGVRIEDDVIVKEDGIECMTQVPRTVEEIERFMKEHNDNVKSKMEEE